VLSTLKATDRHHGLSMEAELCGVPRHNVAVSDVQALAIDRRLPVAQFGLGQMTLLQGQGEIPNAISLLESALATAPAWADALTVCSLHAHRCIRHVCTDTMHLRLHSGPSPVIQLNLLD
jgi:hypothetical protein